jgi:hypothetical protein
MEPISKNFVKPSDGLEPSCGVPKLGARLEKSAICSPDAIFGTPQVWQHTTAFLSNSGIVLQPGSLVPRAGKGSAGC